MSTATQTAPYTSPSTSPTADEAFAAALGDCRKTLMGMALQYLRHRQDAEDAVQSALLKAWSKRGAFRGTCALSTWLGRICINECLMSLRRRRSRREALTDSLPESDWMLQVFDKGPDAFRVAAGRIALERISERIPFSKNTRAVLLLDYLELEHTEVTEMLGVSLNTLKARRHRGTRELREVLR